MKKAIALLALLLATSSLTKSAAAATLDFDSITSGLYNESGFNAFFTDVSFNNTGGDGFQVYDTNNQWMLTPLGAPFFGNIVFNSPCDTPGNATIATFLNPVHQVFVTMGDYGQDEDNLYLEAYNSLNQQIGNDYEFHAFNSYEGHVLSVQSANNNIAYVKFYGIGGGNNSILWDNFSYSGEATSPAPEPASMVLGLVGLGSMLGLRRKNTLS